MVSKCLRDDGGMLAVELGPAVPRGERRHFASLGHRGATAAISRHWYWAAIVIGIALALALFLWLYVDPETGVKRRFQSRG
jgi:hypothetical protein